MLQTSQKQPSEASNRRKLSYWLQLAEHELSHFPCQSKCGASASWLYLPC